MYLNDLESYNFKSAHATEDCYNFSFARTPKVFEKTPSLKHQGRSLKLVGILTVGNIDFLHRSSLPNCWERFLLNDRHNWDFLLDWKKIHQKTSVANFLFSIFQVWEKAGLFVNTKKNIALNFSQLKVKLFFVSIARVCFIFI